MAIYYHCRHCGVNIGTLDQESVNSERLGFDKLSEEERQDMVSYDTQGDIHVTSICEDCQELLQTNPDYHQYDFLIQ